MKKLYTKIFIFITLFIIAFPYLGFDQQGTWNNQVFKIDTLASNLGFPWELTYGPDDSLWVTEARGYKVKKIHPRDKGWRQIVNLYNDKNFSHPTLFENGPQGGLMGMAIHPNYNLGKRYVYLAYVYYKAGPCPAFGAGSNNPCFFNTKIVRFLYPDTGSLKYTLCYGDTILTNLPGSNDHNSGRMAIGPDNKLYYTIGDMGAGQYNNTTRAMNAQNLSVYEGKVLRLNLEPDPLQTGVARWIPDDNPFPAAGPVINKTAIYSYGHRNPQGLVFGNVSGTWRMYSSEHGDRTDDEVNIISAGGNYGWPKVVGFPDNNYNTFDGYTTNDQLAAQNIGREDTFAINNNTISPMFSLFNTIPMEIPAPGSNTYTWRTVGTSNVDYYGTYSNTIPGWRNSILVTSLKHGLFRLKLTSAGDRVDSSSTSSSTDTIAYFRGNRIRDVAINPHGDTLYFAIDSSGLTSGPTGGFNGASTFTPNAGRILRVVYLRNLALRNYIPTNPINNRTIVKVYPNPASKFLYVQSKRGLHKPLRVEMHDITGKKRIQEVTSNDNFSIDLETLMPGMYIFKLYNGFNVLISTEKVIVK